MEIQTQSQDAVRVLTPIGQIDHETAPGFQDALLTELQAGSPSIVLDLSQVPYLSSAGLRVVMIGAKTAQAKGSGLAAAALTDTVAEIFQISRFDAVIALYDDVASACAALSAED